MLTDWLKKVVSPVNKILSDISAVVIVLITLLVVADVSLRRLFNSPIHGTHDLTILGFSMILFLPLAWCALKDGHVELDVIVKKFPKTAQSAIEVLMLLFTVIILVLMSWQIFMQGTKLQASNAQTAILEIPMYPFLYLASFGSLLLTITYLIKFIHLISNIGEAKR